MDQQKRLLMAIALSFGLTMVWTNFVWKPRAEAQARLAKEAAAKLDAGVAQAALDAGTAELPQVAAAPTPVLLEDGGVAEAPPPPVVLAARSFTVERPTTRYDFTTEGGGLAGATLLGDREREEKHLTIVEGWKKLFGATFEPADHMNLAQPAPAVGPQLAVSIIGAAPVSGFQRYAVSEETPGKVVFTTTTGPWQVTKTFTWNQSAVRSDKDPSGYVSTLDVTMKNVSASPITGELAVHAARGITPGSEEAPSMFGGIGNQASVLCSVGGDVKRKTPGSGGGFFGGSSNETSQEEKGQLHYVGIDQQYFLTAVWPKAGAQEGRCLLNASPTFRQASLLSAVALQPGESVTRSYGVFMGPKDLELLLALGKAPLGPPEGGAVEGFDPKLDTSVDFGLWAFICKFLLIFMRSFHNVTGNWGVSIILLTVMVKVLLLPLTHRAMVSAEAMKELQPKMEAIRQKFPDDKEKQNLEMMKLYQEGKVNPLGGCLPLLLQLPIWAALFTTLRTSYELYGEPFFGVWSNLTSKDPTYLLPFALGITMIITQRLQPQMMDKSQAFLMTWVMPVFFTAIMMNYPAGLALYIFTNNLLSIIQQFALRKYLENQKLAKAAAAAGGAK